MEINAATYLRSSVKIEDCPKPDKAEYGFIGRSNVGKSSLINMLCQRKGLAKTSVSPGKTQTLNHFLINEAWYLCDLPGYGYAKVSKTRREDWNEMIKNYLLKRTNLVTVFLLVDSRIPPQKSDLEFMQWMGLNEISFSLIFTKIDKLSTNEFKKGKAEYEKKLFEYWEELPKIFYTSSVSTVGRNDILDFIAEHNESVKDHFLKSDFNLPLQP